MRPNPGPQEVRPSYTLPSKARCSLTQTISNDDISLSSRNMAAPVPQPYGSQQGNIVLARVTQHPSKEAGEKHNPHSRLHTSRQLWGRTASIPPLRQQDKKKENARHHRMEKPPKNLAA